MTKGIMKIWRYNQNHNDLSLSHNQKREWLEMPNLANNRCALEMKFVAGSRAVAALYAASITPMVMVR